MSGGAKGPFFFGKAALFVFLVLSAAVPARAEGGAFIESGSRKASLVELFTSEGCSSCPPADAWLSKLAESRDLWRKYVPVAFHVDYWDRLGWKDPLSDPAHTARQRDYVSQWKSTSTYTPMVAVDGAEKPQWFFGLEAPQQAEAGVLRAVHVGRGLWEVQYLPANGAYLDRVKAHAVFLGSGIVVPVEAGENQGKELKHDFAALAVAEAPMKYEAGVLKATLRFASEGAVKAPRHALAVWVTQKGSAAPLQAAGGYLD